MRDEQGNNITVGRIRSRSILHVGQGQHDHIPNANPNPYPLEGLRSAGEVARLRSVLGVWQFFVITAITPPKEYDTLFGRYIKTILPPNSSPGDVV